MKLKVVIEKGEDFGYVVEVPALPGCVSQGQTRQEALSNIREAIEGWLDVELDRQVNLRESQEVEVVEV